MKNIFAIVVAVVVVMFNNLKAEKRNGKHNQYLPYGSQPYAKANHDQKTKKMRQNSITPPTPSAPGLDPIPIHIVYAGPYAKQNAMHTTNFC